jgi:hypothetical protein
MKKIYTLIFTVVSLTFTAQIEGTWKLDPNPGSMTVSSDSGAAGTVHWAIDAAGVSTRACSWDDSVTFDINGNMDIYKDGLTWIEDWQGTEECNTPISPFGGGSFTYTFANGTLTTNGSGANIGLSKAYNGGEYSTGTTTFQTSVFYRISFFNNDSSFNADIYVGGNWWRFVYSRTSYNPPPPPPVTTYNVTLQVDASNITVGASGMYAGGGVLGDATAVQLADPDGDNIWESVAAFPASGGNYIFLNAPANNGDWGAKEDLNGLSCADVNNWNDRIMPPLNSDTTVCFEYGTCTPCGGTPPPPPTTYNVTFEVHTDTLLALTTATVSADGIYIGGGFVGSYDALPLTLVPNADGKDVWVGIAALAASGGHFTILNGICSDWSCKENIQFQSCSDPNANDDRTNLLGGFTQGTTIVLEYGSCTRPVSSTDISELVNDILIYPNPTANIINIKTTININSLVVYNMIGNLVMTRNVSSNSHTFDVTSLRNGVYFISLNFNDGSVLNSRFIKK